MIGSFPIGSFPIGSVAQEAGQPPVFLQLDSAEASSSGVNATLRQFINLGFAEATAEPLSFGEKITPSLGFATAIASGQIPVPIIRFKIGRAEGAAQGNDLGLKVFPDLTVGEAIAQANNVGGVGLGIFPATSVVNAQDIVPNSFLDTQTGQAQADALILVPLSKLDLTPAEAIVNGISTGIGIETTEAAAIATALDGSVRINVNIVPEIVVTRSEDLTQNVLKVLNSELGNVNIYRASDHRATFAKIADAQTSPFTDSNLDASRNYKYKATFVLTANIGGQDEDFEGPKSNPSYTIGNNTL